MNVTQMVIDNVVRGLVLDARGKWIPIAQMKALESNVLRHLVGGNVFCNGSWVSIQKCKELMVSGQYQPEGMAVASNEADQISQKKGSSWVVVSCNTGEERLAEDQYLRLIRQAAAAEAEKEE
jgi:hypothetical protein